VTWICNSSVGDPNYFFRIRVLFVRPILNRILLLSAPNPNVFGFGSETKLTQKLIPIKKFALLFMIVTINSKLFPQCLSLELCID